MNSEALVAAAIELVQAQAAFEATAEQVNKIMLPAHNRLQTANDAFKAIASDVAAEEAKHVVIDLPALLEAANKEEAQRKADALAKLQAEGAAAILASAGQLQSNETLN